jgi:alpha-glucoside transport system permease protein
MAATEAQAELQPAPRRAPSAVLASLKRALPRLPVHGSVIALALIWSVPTIALLVSSFREPALVTVSGWWNAFSDLEFTLENYQDVLDQRGMGRAFVNSLLLTIPSTILVILIAAMAAYAIAWMDFPGRNVLFLIMVGLLVVPLQMTLIPVLRMYGTLTIESEMPLLGGNIFGINSFAGIWLAHAAFGMPFAIFLLRNFFGSLPRELLESAHLDGASDVGVFFRIILPLSLPAMAALAIFQFLWVWNDLLVALVLLGDPELLPMTVQIQSLVSSFGENYQVLTAAAFVSMIVPLIIFFALQRYIVQGVLAGSVKG